MKRCLLLIAILASTTAAQRPWASWRLAPDHFSRGQFVDLAGPRAARIAAGRPTFAGAGDDAAIVADGLRLVIDPTAAPDVLPQKALTVEAWVRVDADGDWRGIVSAIQDNGAFERGWLLASHKGRFLFGLVTEGKKRLTYLSGNTRFTVGRWYHVAGTWDGRTQRLFVDGVEDATATDQGGPILYAPATCFVLGSYVDDDESHAFRGLIREVQVWDRACSKGELTRRHESVRRIVGSDVLSPDRVAPLPATEGWPAYLHDRHRTGATDEPISLPGRSPLWTLRTPAPAPAWPPPAKGSFWQRLTDIRPRAADDRAPQPVAQGGHVAIASTADDRVRLLDASTGAVLWQYVTEGPIRFAPVLGDELVWFGSDDGHVHAVHRTTGELAWKRLLGPEDRRIPGNGRIISAWPVRTGLVVADGVVYATAGLFPSQGAWAVALDAATGKEIWKQPLDGESPQGYLLASKDRLYVPTGRASPFGLRRKTGTPAGRFGGPGGTYAVLTEDALVSGTGNKGELAVAGAVTRSSLASFRGKRMVVTKETSYLLENDHVRALDRARYVELGKKLVAARAKQEQADRALREARAAEKESSDLGPLKKGLVAASAEVDRLESAREKCILWRKEAGGVEAMIVAGEHVVLGGEGVVTALAVKTGRRLWQTTVEGTALGLAAADGRLLVSTDAGMLYAFGEGAGQPIVPTTSPLGPAPWGRAAADAILEGTALRRGHAVVFDPAGGDLARGLVGASELSVLVVAPDEAGASALRARFLETFIPASRIAVITADDELPLADWIANLVVSERSAREGRPWKPPAEARRILRPDGGVLVVDAFDEQTWERRGPLEGAGSWTHAYADASNTACSRDARVRASMRLQWFGGPGPRPMIDRHLRTSPPLARAGRVFVPALNRVIAVDAYNGTVLWDAETPLSSRTGFPYDAGSMAVGEEWFFYSGKDGCRTLDVRTGRPGPLFKAPETLGRPAPEWGWVALDGAALYGSAQKKGAARREQGRDVLVQQYSPGQGLVTGHTLFRYDVTSGKADWNVRTRFVNTSLTLGGGRLYALESEESAMAEDEDGRVPLAEVFGPSSRLVARDTETGRVLWKRPFAHPEMKHSLFCSWSDEILVVIGCGDRNERNWYWLETFDARTGDPLWKADHANSRGGTHGDHGEQVHHPVITQGRLFAEPAAYELKTGRRIAPDGRRSEWDLFSRRGCGTFSASDRCLFFRNANPSVMDLADGTIDKITRVTRPGCWINILPVGGLVVLPEASSGCVCNFSLQTSMAFAPRE